MPTTRTTTTGRELALVASNNNPECTRPPSGLLVCIECNNAYAPHALPAGGRCACGGALTRRAG